MTKYRLVTNGKFIKIQFTKWWYFGWYDLGVWAFENWSNEDMYPIDKAEKALRDMNILREHEKQKEQKKGIKKGPWKPILEHKIGYEQRMPEAKFKGPTVIYTETRTESTK